MKYFSINDVKKFILMAFGILFMGLSYLVSLVLYPVCLMYSIISNSWYRSMFWAIDDIIDFVLSCNIHYDVYIDMDTDQPKDDPDDTEDAK